MSTTVSALPESQQTQAMIDRISRMHPSSTAEALRELRTAFPDLPLTARVTALEAMRRAGTSR
jgi:hypothetical protein